MKKWNHCGCGCWFYTISAVFFVWFLFFWFHILPTCPDIVGCWPRFLQQPPGARAPTRGRGGSGAPGPPPAVRTSGHMAWCHNIVMSSCRVSSSSCPPDLQHRAGGGGGGTAGEPGPPTPVPCIVIVDTLGIFRQEARTRATSIYVWRSHEYS